MRRLVPCLAFVLACEIDTVPTGLRRTPPGDGPVVRFELAHRPLPDVPFPNDVVAFADPTSRTGLRPNLSSTATTHLEQRIREDFATLEGWGVFAPITIPFHRSPGRGAREAAIDLAAVADRMENDEHDPSDDPFYIVNLATGIPVLVDIGNGYYPAGANVVFETIEEGAGLPQSAYRPDLDRDFDGVLDHPNDRTWYERETDTLIVRPIVPLAEKTEYAVVLTDRLRGPNGQPVRSPFEAIHHPAQRAGITRLRDWLTDKRLANYYGDIAGTGLEHVAFAWTFTTQPTQEDMRILHDGLDGSGPFAHWQTQFPPELEVTRAAQNDNRVGCANRIRTPFIVKPNDEDVRAALRPVFERTFGLDRGALASLEASLAHVSHIAVGRFRSPFLLGDPRSTEPDARFRVDFRTGKGEVTSDEVTWTLVVPKGPRPQPFPVAVWEGGDALLHAGDLARQGIAVIAYDAPGHGRVLGDADRQVLGDACLVPFLDQGRGTRENRPWWTAHLFRARDGIRQSALDGINLVRILRAFDGRLGKQDFDGNGQPDLAGDFDGNGVPDIGGPNVSYFTAGAIASAIQGGVDPRIVAAAPIATGGGLATDVAFHDETGLAQILGPIVFASPGGGCRPEQREVAVQVSADRSVQLVCLDAAELGPRMTVVVHNYSAREVRCARTDADGRFRIPLPTNTGDRLDVQIYAAPDVVDSYDRCSVRPDAPLGRRIADIVAPSEGLGLRRQSPALRQLRDLAQHVIDPADPVVFAPAYRQLEHALLAVYTPGDSVVPVSATLTLARSAGAVPFLPPSAVERLPHYADDAMPGELYERLGRKTSMRYLVENGVAGSVPSPLEAECKPNHQPNAGVCTGTPDPSLCATALFDADWVSEGGLPFGQPHPETPLRLARISRVRAIDPATLAAAWEPRLRGAPFAADEIGWTATERLVGLFGNYVAPTGGHGWGSGDICRVWDPAIYGDGLVARFFATDGRDLLYLSHPKTHTCLASGACEFLR